MKKLKVNATWFINMSEEDEKKYLQNQEEINQNVAEWIENELETENHVIVKSEIINL